MAGFLNGLGQIGQSLYGMEKQRAMNGLTGQDPQNPGILTRLKQLRRYGMNQQNAPPGFGTIDQIPAVPTDDGEEPWNITG